MIESSPLRWVPASSPPPGPVETAVSLMAAQAAPLRPDAWELLVAHLLGVGGGPPVPAGLAAEAAGVPVSWLRGLLGRVRMVARHAGPPVSVVEGVQLLQDGPVRTLAEARDALVAAGVSASGVHPGGVLRVAEVVGLSCAAGLVEAGGEVFVAPVGRVALERAVAAAVATEQRRGDVVDVTAVAHRSGAPVVVAVEVLGRRSGWRVHHTAQGAVWCWRRGVRQRGLVTALAVRMLSVRPYGLGELGEALVEVLDRLPPVTRRDAVVPPAAVLAVWLADQGLLEHTGTTSGVDDPAGAAGGGGVVLRCREELALPNDVVMLQAVHAAGGEADVEDIAQALRAAGAAASTADQLARTSPVLRRVARGRYTHR